MALAGLETAGVGKGVGFPVVGPSPSLAPSSCLWDLSSISLASTFSAVKWGERNVSLT